MRDYKRIYAEEVNDNWALKPNMTLERLRPDYSLDSFKHREQRKKDALYRERKCRTAEDIWFDYPEMVAEIGKGKVASMISNMPNDLWDRKYRKPDKHHTRYQAKIEIDNQIDDLIVEKKEEEWDDVLDRAMDEFIHGSDNDGNGK